MDLVYMHPGGVRTAMALFFFYKVSFEKHPNEHIGPSEVENLLVAKSLTSEIYMPFSINKPIFICKTSETFL